jgi:hypothetical protein
MAHRVSFEMTGGDVTARVLHRCDNRSCVRRKHLFSGTDADNMRDMVEKGRAPSGDRHPSTKLDDARALEMLKRHQAGERIPDLARAYGVSEETAYRRTRMVGR